MNPAMIMSPVPDERDGSTRSMVEVDAAARAALADHLELRDADLEHPAVVAVLAAVVTAGWRPPTRSARPDGGVLAPAADAEPSMALFGDPGDPLEPGWAAAAGVGRHR